LSENDESSLALLLTTWARSRNWQHEAVDEGETFIVLREDELTRVELSLFSTEQLAMIEFYDRKRARGGIFSLHYNDQPEAILESLDELGRPNPDALPALLNSLMDRFSLVYDSSDGTDIPINHAHFQRIVAQFQIKQDPPH
jgi:hypothetical protein